MTKLSVGALGFCRFEPFILLKRASFRGLNFGFGRKLFQFQNVEVSAQSFLSRHNSPPTSVASGLYTGTTGFRALSPPPPIKADHEGNKKAKRNHLQALLR